MDHLSKLVAAFCLTWSAAASAQTYQVGQYLGNMNDLNRFTYNTMGSAAQHANYGPGGANWTTLAGQNAARMAGTATATIGGRTVPLTLISRVPVPAIAAAARGVAGMHPGVAAAVLLGGLAFDHWIEAGNLRWNTDPATSATHPFLKQVDSDFSACPILTSAQNADWLGYVASRNNVPCAYSVCTAVAKRWVEGNMCVWGYTEDAPQWSGPNRVQDLSFMRFAKVNNPTIELVPYTWEQAEPDLGNILPEKLTGVDWKGITERVLQKGGSIDPSKITSTVSGPASQQGQRTERNLSNGDKSVTQTTHNYTYNNNNVTHNTTTTTTVTNVNNQVVSEETESTDNPVPDEPQPDLCEKNPDILACQKLGEPETVELETQEREATITPESGFGGAGQCPAPRYIYPQGRTIAIPFDLFCMYAEGLRPVIIALSWVSAGIILIGARGGD